MNDLTPTNAQPPTLSDLAISAPLWKLLSSNVGAQAEIEEIAADPRLRSEALAILPALMLRASPSGDERVMRALRPLVLVYGASEATKAPAFWQAYYAALSGLPVEALARGITDYTSAPDSEFFPKPGPLRALCDKHAEPIFKAASRARRALEVPTMGRTLPSEEEKAGVANMLRDFSASVQAKEITKVRPAQPSIAGKVDQHGITQEMRELIARRQGT